MIKIEVDKKYFKLSEKSSPILNFFIKATELESNHLSDIATKIISWHQHTSLKVDINKVTDKINKFSTLIRSKPLVVKNLGSENKRTAFWAFSINSRKYFFFLSIHGLSIETTSDNQVKNIIEDLKEWSNTYLDK